MRASRTITVAASVLSIAAYAVTWVALRPRVFANSNPDFACFYRAGRMVLDGDASRAYDLTTERDYDEALGMAATDKDGKRVSLPFVFAPITLPFFALLSSLSYAHAELAWYLLNVGLLLGWPLVLGARLHWSNTRIAIALLLPPFFLPVTLALLQGQPSIVLLLLITLAYLDLASGHDVRAGWWLALGVCKPQLVLPMLLALAAWRRWQALRSFLWSSALLSVASALVVGWQAIMSYPRALVAFSRLAANSGGEHPASMPNLRGAAWSLPGPHMSEASVEAIAATASVLLLTAMFLLLARRPRVTWYSFSLVVLLTLITSHHSYLHDDVLLLLPMFLVPVLRRSHSPQFQIAAVAIAAAIVLLPVFPSSLRATAVQVSALAFAWTVLLGSHIIRESVAAATKRASVVPPSMAV